VIQLFRNNDHLDQFPLIFVNFRHKKTHRGNRAFFLSRELSLVFTRDHRIITRLQNEFRSFKVSDTHYFHRV